MKVSVVIPVLNEAKSIGLVLDAIPKANVHEVVVVDNGSSDGSASIARLKGAKVVHEVRCGYGRACRTGLRILDHPDVVVFMEGDFSDVPEELPKLLQPLQGGEVDFVLGSRILGHWDRGSIRPHVLWRNRIVCFLARLLYHKKYTDIAPFRAIRYSVLQDFKMRELSYGWNLEMQLKAARHHIKTVELPVRYRMRVGESKLSGSFRGCFSASLKNFWTLFRYLS
ncbi:MAG: glycosyltransferase family 2 protein [Candidatus Omnitrophota bacterium]